MMDKMQEADEEVSRRVAGHNFWQVPGTAVAALIQLREQNKIIIELLQKLVDK
jgi:hypothetical protein